MANEKKKSICRLDLDIGVHVEDVHDIGRRKEDLVMRVFQHFGYISPLSLIREIEENTYVCMKYTEDLKNCKKCPAYQQ